MMNYYDFMMRHGEYGVQALVEGLERREGIRSNIHIPLEQRWTALMHADPQTSQKQQKIAA